MIVFDACKLIRDRVPDAAEGQRTSTPSPLLPHTHTHPHNHYMTYRVYLCYLCCYEQPCRSRGSVGVMYTQNWSLWEVGML